MRIVEGIPGCCGPQFFMAERRSLVKGVLEHLVSKAAGINEDFHNLPVKNISLNANSSNIEDFLSRLG